MLDKQKEVRFNPRKSPRGALSEKVPGRPSEPNALRGIKVSVVTERDDQGNFLILELQRLGVQVRHVWPAPPMLSFETEVIYCDYAADLARSLPWVPGDAKSALVIILPPLTSIDPEALAKATPDAVLARPFTVNAVLASLVVARSQFRYEQRLRSKLDRLDDNLRSMRTVERAKSILMSTRQIDGDQAYSFIRHQAMDRRVSVSSIAAAIVSSHELLGPDPK
ncbi:MAG: ANTAR domain-containing protein [Rhodomicrobium sp.]